MIRRSHRVLIACREFVPLNWMLNSASAYSKATEAWKAPERTAVKYDGAMFPVQASPVHSIMYFQEEHFQEESDRHPDTFREPGERFFPRSPLWESGPGQAEFPTAMRRLMRMPAMACFPTVRGPDFARVPHRFLRPLRLTVAGARTLRRFQEQPLPGAFPSGMWPSVAQRWKRHLSAA